MWTRPALGITNEFPSTDTTKVQKIELIQCDGGGKWKIHFLSATLAMASDVSDFFAISSTPPELGRRRARGLAGQVDQTALLDHHVRGGALVHDGGGHDHTQVALLTPHGLGVDLTHVPASIRLLHVVQVQSPDLVVVVGEGDPLVSGDDVMVYGQNGLRVNPDPGHLEPE